MNSHERRNYMYQVPTQVGVFHSQSEMWGCRTGRTAPNASLSRCGTITREKDETRNEECVLSVLSFLHIGGKVHLVWTW